MYAIYKFIYPYRHLYYILFFYSLNLILLLILYKYKIYLDDECYKAIWTLKQDHIQRNFELYQEKIKFMAENKELKSINSDLDKDLAILGNYRKLTLAIGVVITITLTVMAANYLGL
jgi:hypothetical protein